MVKVVPPLKENKPNFKTICTKHITTVILPKHIRKMLSYHVTFSSVERSVYASTE